MTLVEQIIVAYFIVSACASFMITSYTYLQHSRWIGIWGAIKAMVLWPRFAWVVLKESELFSFRKIWFGD